MRLLFSFVGLALATDCSDESATVLIQNQLRLKETKPWDRRTYIVGTNHKAGSQLLRNVMCHVFDTLDATRSCQYAGNGPSVTTAHRNNDCYKAEPNEFSIRFHNHIWPGAVEAARNETGGNLRVVVIVRNPMEMLASDYCYHHRGAEPGSPMAPPGIMQMEPEVGVPAVANGLMHLVIKDMVGVARMQGPDVMVVRHEDFTKSSKSFDAMAPGCKFAKSLFFRYRSCWTTCSETRSRKSSGNRLRWLCRWRISTGGWKRASPRRSGVASRRTTPTTSWT